MRTTLTIDDAAFEKASKLTGISKKGELIREALDALIAKERGRRLRDLGGSMPGAEDVPRRRSEH